MTGTIKEDRDKPLPVTVRLLAIHVVSTLVGHPEFVWASFEHSTAMVNGMSDVRAADGQRDVAPIGPDDLNPDPVDLNRSVMKPADADKDYILYKKGTATNVASKPFDSENQHAPGRAEVHEPGHDPAVDVDLPHVPGLEVEHHRSRRTRSPRSITTSRRCSTRPRPTAPFTPTTSAATTAWSARNGWTSRGTTTSTSRSRTIR